MRTQPPDEDGDEYRVTMTWVREYTISRIVRAPSIGDAATIIGDEIRAGDYPDQPENLTGTGITDARTRRIIPIDHIVRDGEGTP